MFKIYKYKNISGEYFGYVKSQAESVRKYERIFKQLNKDILYGIMADPETAAFYIERVGNLPKYIKEDIIRWAKKQGYRYIS